MPEYKTFIVLWQPEAGLKQSHIQAHTLTHKQAHTQTHTQTHKQAHIQAHTQTHKQAHTQALSKQ